METLKQRLVINSRRYLKVIKLLLAAGAQARLVGGVVRDALARFPSSDVDIATDFSPEQVTALLEANKIKVIPTGIKFGTILAVTGGETFEITTLREDLSCDGRRAIVKYTNDFKKDAERRDFTINALSYCPIKHEIYDYFNGIEDLKKRRVVFIGNAEARIQEDYLRILRFFRFSCRFSKELDEPSFQACVRYKDKLSILSRERVKSEMDALLKLRKSPKFLAIMNSCGILKEVFPIKHYDYKLHSRAINIARKYKSWPCLSVVYAILLHKDPEISLSSLIDMKFSKAEAKIIMQLIALRHIKEKNQLVIKLKTLWLDEISCVQYFIFASVFIKDYQYIFDLYNGLLSRQKPILPIKGNDLIKIGLSGQNLGSLIRKLKEEWIQSEFTLQKADLINLAEQYEK
ncbi:MAG: CCA tRNA nucleotidyltransferase [Rickettsiaceae bacterium]